jgi:hypothetical protein
MQEDQNGCNIPFNCRLHAPCVWKTVKISQGKIVGKCLGTKESYTCLVLFINNLMSRSSHCAESSEVEVKNHRETLSKLGWHTTMLSWTDRLTDLEIQQTDTSERQLIKYSNEGSNSISYSVSYSYRWNSRHHGWKNKKKKKPPPPPPPEKKKKSSKGSYSHSYPHYKKKKKKKKKHGKSLPKKSKKSPKSKKHSKGKSKRGSLSYSYPKKKKKKTSKSGPKSKGKGSKGGGSSYSYSYNYGSSSSKRGSSGKKGSSSGKKGSSSGKKGSKEEKGGKDGSALMKRSFGTTPHKEKNVFLRLKMERAAVFNKRSWRHQPDGEYNSNF